jgi:uncharacterized protein YggE
MNDARTQGRDATGYGFRTGRRPVGAHPGTVPAIAALAAAAVLAFGAAAPAVAQGVAQPAGAELRIVTVGGSGEVRAAPDLAIVTLGVTARRPTVEAARQEANRVTDALLATTRGLKIADAQVRSTGVNVNPEYTWNEAKRQREFAGYVVTRQLVVDLREIDKLGTLLEKSLTAGANLVQEPMLDSSQRADLERRALALAVEDARRNAEVLARGVGMAVGTARSVSGNGESQPRPMPAPPMMRAAMADAAVESPQTYQAGELVFSARADVTYDLVPAGR